MAFLAWLVRLIVAAVVLRLVMRLFSGGRPRAQARTGRERVERAGGTLVQDSHCGTYIPMSKALVSGRGAEAKYFCSATCRDQYLAAHGRRHAS